MPILRSIIHGFGFTVGARAAGELLDELGKADESDTEAEAHAKAAAKPAAPVKSARQLEKERAAAMKAVDKEKRRREAEIDEELRALKKRMAKKK